jgi:glucose-1-phosphate cytidylyltransferase
MKTVILCGGQGTRIRDVSEVLPKPMINIGPYPILWHIMKYYAFCGFKDFVLCLGYKATIIKDFFINYRCHTSDFSMTLGQNGSLEIHSDFDEMDWKVTMADTGQNAMTGARVRKIQKYIGDDENFFLTYGDGVGDVDLNALLKFHKAHGRILTVTGVRPPGRFGEIRANSDSQVVEFNEKPQASAGRISGGFFVCRREIFDYLKGDDELIFEIEPIRALTKAGQLMLFEHDGFWQPMDTHREFLLLNDLFRAGRAPWAPWSN